MKSRRLKFIFILCIPIPLVIAGSFLIRQSIEYRSANRDLILQNDSLKSVLIKMNQQIEEIEKASITVPKTPRK
jgi:uncharacterized membrane protein YciS (DUF1049 family)